MIVLVFVGILIVVLIGFAQLLGLIFGAILAFWPRRKEPHFSEPPSHVRLLESHVVTEEDLEGWDGEDELEL